MKRNGHVAINYFIMRYEERILNTISSNIVEQTIYLLEIILQWWMACFKIEAFLMGAFQRSRDTQSNSQLLLHFNRHWISYFCQRLRRVNSICRYLCHDDPQTITNSKLSKNILVITPFASNSSSSSCYNLPFCFLFQCPGIFSTGKIKKNLFPPSPNECTLPLPPPHLM